MSLDNGHGGARPGAGRPPGSVNKRSAALAEALISEGRCPIRALARLAERAEAEGDLTTAIAAWRTVAPYVHARPKPVESEPDGVIELARALNETAGVSAHQLEFADLLEQFVRNREKEA